MFNCPFLDYIESFIFQEITSIFKYPEKRYENRNLSKKKNWDKSCSSFGWAKLILFALFKVISMEITWTLLERVLWLFKITYVLESKIPKSKSNVDFSLVFVSCDSRREEIFVWETQPQICILRVKLSLRIFFELSFYLFIFLSEIFSILGVLCEKRRHEELNKRTLSSCSSRNTPINV